MLTMFVFGLMNILVLIALTVLMIAEQRSSIASGLTKFSGAVLIGAGICAGLLAYAA